MNKKKVLKEFTTASRTIQHFVNRGSALVELGEVCIQTDKDAQKDFTHRMRRTLEKKNWWISLNTSGRNEPMRNSVQTSVKHQTKLHPLHRESGEERLAPIPSGSIKNGIRRLLHPAHHGGSGTMPGGAFLKKQKKSSTSELMDSATAKNGETCGRHLLIKLLRVEC